MFPEILSNEHLFDLENHVKDLRELMLLKVNSIEINQTKEIPRTFLQDLKDMGLFGRLIPSKYGGMDLTYTAFTRLNEVLGLDWSLSSRIIAHECLATQVLLHYGSEEQKHCYLPKLASGRVIGAFASSELKGGSDLMSISTQARETQEGNFIINGVKAWVSNASTAEVFIVFVKTQNKMDSRTSDISVFLVDKTDKMKIIPQDKVCLNGLQTATVHFEEVAVSRQNIIGSLGQGFEIHLKALESFRIALSTLPIGALKALLDSLTHCTINKERYKKSLADYQLVRARLSRINSMIYAMESVTYFTAALIDSTENPDTSLEASALKVFNSEGTLYCLREMLEVLGSSSLVEKMQLERFHRDAMELKFFDAPNDIVLLYLGLKGCQFAGQNTAETIMRNRNTFFFPSHTIKQLWRHWKIKRGWKQFDQDIAGHIHPSLVEWGNKLESSLQFFEVCVEAVLSRHGKEIINAQIAPAKLANIAIDLYAWSAVLSRCSRSYCLGLNNSHHELLLAETFCFDADRRVFSNVKDLLMGMAHNNEANHLRLGEQVIDCQGYFPEHPLKHNF